MNPATFSALAEPHRLEIVELIRDKPRPVKELVDRLRLNQPQVSKHLKVLADAGIVEVKPLAQQRIYTLQPKPFLELEAWLKRMKHLWSGRFDKLDEVLRGGEKI